MGQSGPDRDSKTQWAYSFNGKNPGLLIREILVRIQVGLLRGSVIGNMTVS